MAHSNPVEFDGVKLYVDWTKPNSYTAQEILIGAKVGRAHRTEAKYERYLI